jgi:cysteine sulfinate desulfinase/cysteine desulfurase-like protein
MEIHPRPQGMETAMGVLHVLVLGAVRFSLGRETTAPEIDTVIARVAGVLAPE